MPMKTLLSLFLALASFSPRAFAADTSKLNVLVWDLYFDPLNKYLPRENNQGSLGSSFSFLPDAPRDSQKMHGLQVATVILRNNPNATVHMAFNPGIPWQDPEKCALVHDIEFEQAVKKNGHSPLPLCKEEAEAGIKRFSEFIRAHKIRVVNMSHGVFYDNYVRKNPDLLARQFPGVDKDLIHQFLYRNFLAIGSVVKKLFEENPNTLFVLAAGNNDDEVERELPLPWLHESLNRHYVPTFYAAYTSQFSNIVSVASTYDGKKIAPGSNYSGTNVSLVKKIENHQVPDEKGNMFSFGGTSAAAAEISRLVSMLWSQKIESLNAKDWKILLEKSVDRSEAFKGKVISGGVLNEQALISNLESYSPIPADQPLAPVITPLKIEQREGKFFSVPLPDEANVKNYGCHSLAIDSHDVVWITMPWSNRILSFQPATNTFSHYPLPTPASKPDGIAIDSQNRVWFGLDPKGGLGMIDPVTKQIQEFPHPLLTRMNIIDVDPQGNIWGTSHDARVVSKFDISTKTFRDFRVYTDWPLDLRADVDGSIWVAGLKGFGKPWGPGALVRVGPEEDKINYFPLPPKEERLQAYWLQPSQDYVVLSMMRDGLAVLNKHTHSINLFQREDKKQIYNIVRKSKSGKFLVANAHEFMKSLDILDPLAAKVVSYALPDQKGEPREGMGFDSQGDLWYCQTFSPNLGKLRLPLY